MKTLAKIILLFTIILFSTTVNAQYLVSATQLQSRSATQVQSILNSQGWNVATMTINPVISYKIVYNTIDVHGNPTVASGAVYVPQVACDTLPLVSCQHGTEFDRETVPSNGNYAREGLLYSGNGYITTLPDYLGMGVNPGFHPYIHAESEATASIDLIRATREFLLDSLGIRDNNQLFLTGYSQGGHATMAMHKYLSENNLLSEFNVIASAPLSGPYDLSGSQFDLVFDGDSTYYTSMFLPYTNASYQLVYGDMYSSYDEYYDSPYDASIETYLNSGMYSNAQWSALIPTNYYDFMQDSVIDNLISNPNHPVRVHLRDNDLYDWAPMESVRMLYCGSDSMVSPVNSTFTRDTMVILGAIDVEAIDLNPSGTHETCFTPASRYALDWFDSLQAPCQMIVEITEPTPLTKLVLFPNPARDLITVSANTNLGFDYRIYDLSGRTIRSGASLTGTITIDASLMTEGRYFIECQPKNAPPQRLPFVISR